ncbi:MAG: ATP-binding cassette domain-containing protein, partial [Sciscionella sp.]
MPENDSRITPGEEKHPVLELRKVSKHFGGVVAADEVSLQVRPNEVVGLVGNNGAGKSTLMRMVS